MCSFRPLRTQIFILENCGEHSSPQSSFCDRNRIELFIESVSNRRFYHLCEKTVDFPKNIVYNEIRNLNMVRFWEVR